MLFLTAPKIVIHLSFTSLKKSARTNSRVYPWKHILKNNKTLTFLCWTSLLIPPGNEKRNPEEVRGVKISFILHFIGPIMWHKLIIYQDKNRSYLTCKKSCQLAFPFIPVLLTELLTYYRNLWIWILHIHVIRNWTRLFV